MRGIMGKWIRRVIMLAVLAVFLFSVSSAVLILRQYKESDRLYSQAAGQYTIAAPADETPAEMAPITVDFDALRDVCGDVCGWIYCEDTPINYPVVQGEDDDYYLRRSYDGTANSAGSIFVEADNRRDFADSNTIIYGHHMKNDSMFATLENWADQEFYEEHPVMWLLTPEQDYKLVLFSGYTTPAASDSYLIFTGPGEKLDAYLKKCKGQSDFSAEVELDGEAHYVMLSTCAYVFDNARYVLHGKLTPVASAGGAAVP